MNFGIFAVIAFWLFMVVGWIMNIVKIIGSLDDPTVTPLFIARIVGAVAAPVGAILGWF